MREYSTTAMPPLSPSALDHMAYAVKVRDVSHILLNNRHLFGSFSALFWHLLSFVFYRLLFIVFYSLVFVRLFCSLVLFACFYRLFFVIPSGKNISACSLTLFLNLFPSLFPSLFPQLVPSACSATCSINIIIKS